MPLSVEVEVNLQEKIEETAPDTGFFTQPSMAGASQIILWPTIFMAIILFAFIIFRFKKATHAKHHNFRLSHKKRLAFSSLAIMSICLLAIVGVINYKNDDSHALDFLPNAIDFTADETVEIDANVLGSNDVAYGKTTITLNTPTTGGYILYVYSPSLQDDGNSLFLEGSDFALASIIDETGQGINLEDGTYGITTVDPESTDETAIWHNIPLEKNLVALQVYDSSTQAGDTIDLYFGIKASELQPGVYSSILNYEIIPLYYMQDMDVEICQSLSLETQYQFMDTRDSKLYYISRLKMNESGTNTACWMTQNLNLNLDEHRTFYSTDSDIQTESKTFRSNFYDYIDPGKYYIFNQDTQENEEYDSLGACLEAGYARAECQHAEAGGSYYVVDRLPFNTMKESICPKGWRPWQSNDNYGYNSEIVQLMAAYGIDFSNIALDTLSSGQTLKYNVDNFSTILNQSPIYQVFSYDPMFKENYSQKRVITFGRDKNSTIRMFFYENEGTDYSVGIFNLEWDANIRCVSRGIQYSVSYGVDGISGYSTEASSTTTELNITTDAPVLTGKNFMGWSTTENAATAEYQSGGTIILMKDNPTVTLYPVWQDIIECNPAATTIGDAVCMQDMNDDIKSSMNLNEQYQLVDSRDGKSYYIAKVAKSATETEVIMTQNLNLSLNKNAALTADNTDLNTMSEWKPILSTNETTAMEFTPYYSETQNIYVAGVEGPHGGATVYRYDQSGSNCITSQYERSSHQRTILGRTSGQCSDIVNELYTTSEHYNVGTLYSYGSAMAVGTDENFDPAFPTHDYMENDPTVVTQNSICPKSWSLPAKNTLLDIVQYNHQKIPSSGLAYLFYEDGGAYALFNQSPLYIGAGLYGGYNNIEGSHTYMGTKLFTSGYSINNDEPGVFLNAFYVSPSFLAWDPYSSWWMDLGAASSTSEVEAFFAVGEAANIQAGEMITAASLNAIRCMAR